MRPANPAAGAGGRQLLHDAPLLRRDHDQQVVDGAQERTVEEPVGVTVCSGKYQEAVAHAVQVAAAAAPGPQHGCVGHTPRICVPPLDRRSRRSRSGGGPCGLAVRVPPLRRSVELRTGCDQRYATKRCLQLHYLANASSTGPRSGTLRCGAALERGPARSSRDQAVVCGEPHRSKSSRGVAGQHAGAAVWLASTDRRGVVLIIGRISSWVRVSSAPCGPALSSLQLPIRTLTVHDSSAIFIWADPRSTFVSMCSKSYRYFCRPMYPATAKTSPRGQSNCKRKINCSSCIRCSATCR